jgi:hypothetical protein
MKFRVHKIILPLYSRKILYPLREDHGIEFLEVDKLDESIDSDQMVKKVGGDRTTD